jgi:hypothetical protein
VLIKWGTTTIVLIKNERNLLRVLEVVKLPGGNRV